MTGMEVVDKAALPWIENSAQTKTARIAGCFFIHSKRS